MDKRFFTQHSATAPAPARVVDQRLTGAPDNSTRQLKLVLSRLGLGNYFNCLVANGFTTWDIVLDITEEDLESMSFKLGHRRRLQREIASHRDRRTLTKVSKSSNTSSHSAPARAGNIRDSVEGGLHVSAEKSKFKLDALDYSSSAASRTTLRYDAVNRAMSEISHLLEAKSSDLNMFDGTNLPPYEETMLAVTAFLHGSGARMFMWSRDEASSMILTGCNPHFPTDFYALVDLLAMAAVGSICDFNCFTEELRASYYFSCLQLFSTCTEATNLSCMRVFLCLSVYCAMRNPDSASKLNAAALEIGRIERLQSRSSKNVYSDAKGSWRKVFRSVILMECIFCYGFGFESRLTEQETTFACSRFNDNTSMEDIIQEQASCVACIAAEISTKAMRDQVPSIDLIKDHIERLNHWYWGLPRVMQLATLHGGYSGIFSDFQKRSVLLVHMQSLSAIAIVHRPVLIAIAKSQLAGTWDFDNTLGRFSVYQEYCIEAAQQASRIAAMLHYDGQVPKHCWMTIFESSNACSILLFSASQKLFYSSPKGIEADFACIENFLPLLSWCGTAEPIFNQTLDTITAIYEGLKTLWQLKFPHTEGNKLLWPTSEQNNELFDEVQAHQRQTPVYQPFPLLNPNHDSTIDPLLFGRTILMDPNLAVILQQIIDLAKSLGRH